MTTTLKLKLRGTDLERVKRICLSLALLVGCSELQRDGAARAATQPAVTGAIAAAVPQPWGPIIAIIASAAGGFYLRHSTLSKPQPKQESK